MDRGPQRAGTPGAQRVAFLLAQLGGYVSMRFAERLTEIGAAYERDAVRALSADERRTLGELLAELADSHDLAPDVHPGYRAPR